jgi:predicted NAD/FAD-binding protein
MIDWFDRAGVEFEKSDMSLAVSVDAGTTMEWSSSGLSSMFAQRSNLVNYKFHRFVYEMTCFQSDVMKWLAIQETAKAKGNDPDLKLSIGQFLRDRQYSKYFIDFYLIPVVCTAAHHVVSATWNQIRLTCLLIFRSRVSGPFRVRNHWRHPHTLF